MNAQLRIVTATGAWLIAACFACALHAASDAATLQAKYSELSREFSQANPGWRPASPRTGLLLFIASDEYSPVRPADEATLDARKKYADALFELAKQAAASGQSSLAFQWTTETLWENPDHTDARRVLGYVESGGKWLTPYGVKMRDVGKTWDAQKGWIATNATGAPIPESRIDSARHADIKNGWQVGTDHFSVTTNHSLSAGAELAAQLERLYQIWRQQFAGFNYSEKEIRGLFAGERVPRVHLHSKSKSIARLNLRSITHKLALYTAQTCIGVATTGLLAAVPIAPSDRLPASSPWDLRKLSEPPKFEWIDAKSPVRSLYYEGEQFRGHPTRVFAYYASPATLDPKGAKGKTFPAVVLLHGGGGTAFSDWAKLWAKRGYAAIAMDTAGHQPIEGKSPYDLKNLSQLPDGGPDQGEEGKFGSIDKPPTEQWEFHAVSAAIRAHSLIRSFPEVDASRTALTGISWGGYLTCIVAGVDNRFKVAVPVYGCGHLQENSAWLPHFAKMSPEGRDRWAKLWDPSKYVPAINVPILFINGTNDHAYPIDSYMKTYHDAGGTKNIRIAVKMPHSHQDGWAPAEIGQFIDQHLRDGRPLPKVTEVKKAAQKVVAKFKAEGKVTAKLNFTSDRGDFEKREWQSQLAAVDGETVSAVLPSQEIAAWFITITDDRDSTASSEVYFK